MRPLPVLLWRGVQMVAPDVGVWLHGINLVLHGVNVVLVFIIAEIWTETRWARFCLSIDFSDLPGERRGRRLGRRNSGRADDDGRTRCCRVKQASSLLCRDCCGRRGRMSGRRPLEGDRGRSAGSVADCPRLGPGLMAPGDARMAGCCHGQLHELRALAVDGGPAAGGLRLAGVAGTELKEFLVRPFANLAAPWSVSVLSQFPWIRVGGVLVVLALVVGFVFDRRTSAQQARIAGGLIAWVLVTALPVGTDFFVSPWLEGSRYLYLPSVGWAILLAMYLDRVRHATVAPGRWLASGLAAAVVVPAVIALPIHLGAWTRASALREQALASVVAMTRAAGCREAMLSAAPDSIEGAYVFRSGIKEALEPMGIRMISTAQPPCRFHWSGRGWTSQ